MIEIRPSVAIVGAGLAGLTAARLLASRGYPVSLLDKGRGPGGRATTRREGEFVFDHGCQYLTARDPRFLSYLEVWAEQAQSSVWPARLANCERGAILPFQDDSPRWVGVPGMSAIAKTMAAGLDLRLETRIASLQRSEEGWAMASDAQPLDDAFELVIVAVPPDQAIPLLAASPRLQSAAATVRMQPCWAVMAAFEYDLDLPFDAAFFHGGPVVWAANNGSKPGRPDAECWILHASPAWSREHLEDAPEKIIAPVLEDFFRATGLKPLKPLFAKTHRWRYASPENPLGEGCLWDNHTGLGVCGDWCHSARAEGAFLSGLQLAEKILAERPRAQYG